MGTNRNDEAFYFIGFCILSVWLNYNDHLLRTYAHFLVQNKRTEKTRESALVLSYSFCSVGFAGVLFKFHSYMKNK